MEPNRGLQFGETLIGKGLITQEQLDEALRKQKETAQLLGVILLEMGYVSEETVFLPVLANQHGVEYVDLRKVEITADCIKKIPPKFATHYQILPIRFTGNTLTVAMAHPNDVQVLDEISLVVPERINPVLASEKEITESIRKYYGTGAETIDQMMGDVSESAGGTDIQHIDEFGSEASISNFLNQILLEAYRDRATDIHIEPYEDELQIRYRIDGIMRDAKVPSNIVHFKDSINSRIKILSNLNIAEKRKPQDGRFKVRVEGVDIDLRVSFLPTPYGESVVLRILSSTSLLSFDQLGLSKKDQDVLNMNIAKPHGIIFLTGPTGSGKTTTLYSCLSQINTVEKKIITIEDPIEYQLKGVTQIQINPEIGLTFAQGLRSMLRHDPDVMMVGEVRDKETAEIAIQVALTGHLVFSTLHTNDAASGVTRLLDMDVDPFLITSTVECFIAQRLIRLMCPTCKAEAQCDEQMLKDFEGIVSVDPHMKIYEAHGCEACNFTGYSGRSGIHEILLMSDPIRQLIMKRATAGEIKEQAMKEGMMTLAQEGWAKVQEGLTTPQEVMRVTQDDNG